jgi:hypothetical protein
VLLTGSPADPLLPDLDAQQAAMAAQLPDCRRWRANGGGHPAMWTDTRGFLAAVRF